ncbi:MAG: hypothetical protein LBU60_00125 [Clostridiales bacterium]|jgi:hypothetical protein|nr:hypothetical protein [Clostridiales bacterium]
MNSKAWKLIDRLIVVLVALVLASQILVRGNFTKIFVFAFNNVANNRLIEGEWVDFFYTGGEQEFLLQADKMYEIESWGANGGLGGSNATTIAGSGGLGGYATGFVHTDIDRTLYIVVGGVGANRVGGNEIAKAKGGYNGGGDAGERFSGSGSTHAGGGGGATHMALASGKLAELEGSKNAVVIVSGAGGSGSDIDIQSGGGRGGNGGALQGENGYDGKNNNNNGKGGEQLKGGEHGNSSNGEQKSGFGQGGEGNSWWNGAEGSYRVAGAGGGSGWYGGGGAKSDNVRSYGAGGGSSYVQTEQTLTDLSIEPMLPLYDGFTASADESGFTENPDSSGNGFARIREVSDRTEIFASFEVSDNDSGVVGVAGQTGVAQLQTVVQEGGSIDLEFEIGEKSYIKRLEINGERVELPIESGKEQTQDIVGARVRVSHEDNEKVKLNISEVSVLELEIVAKVQHAVVVRADKQAGWVTSPTEEYEVWIENGQTFGNSNIVGWEATHPEYSGFEIEARPIFGYTEFDVNDYAVNKESQSAPEFESTEIAVQYGENGNKLQLTAKGGNEGVVYQVQSGEGSVTQDGLVSIVRVDVMTVIAYRQSTDTAMQSGNAVLTINVAKGNQSAPEFENVVIDVLYGDNGNKLQLIAKGGNEGVVYQVQSGEGSVTQDGLVNISGVGTIKVTAFMTESENYNPSSSVTITINVEQEQGIPSPDEKDDSRLFSKETLIFIGLGLGVLIFMILVYVKVKLKKKN